MRAELPTALLSATAFGTRSRPTISSTNAWRAGSSTTVTKPSAIASPNTIQTCTTPVSTISHIATASSAASVCVTSSTLRRSKRSAIDAAPQPEQQHRQEAEREGRAHRDAAAR